MDLKSLQQEIAKKKQNYPLDWLGRSLAYTPYQPRPLKEILTKTPLYSPKNLSSIPNTQDFLEISKTKAEESSCFLVDSLENLTFIRRYINKPLIFNYPIIDSYQILETLVFGADCIVLIPSILPQKTLKELSDFASKIGLEKIFNIHSKEDLSKAILAKADILNIQESKNLISLIPNSKIILAHKTLQETKGIDAYLD